MRQIFVIVLILQFALIGCEQSSKKNQPPRITRAKDYFNFNVKIPSEWVEQIRNYKYGQSDSKLKYDPHNSKLLKDFDSFLAPDHLFIPDYGQPKDKNEGGILNPMFTDLDGSPESELICLLGWDDDYPSLAIFKKIEGDWRLLYLEPFYMFYSMPEFAVANSFSKNKTFYFRRMNEHGSGVYSDSYSFYKLINNKVYNCLNLINEAHIDGWGLFLNQDVKANFKFNGTDADEVWVWYTYNFFPGAIKESDCPWCSHNDVSLVKDEKGMNYKWDSTRMVYKPEVSAKDDSTDLTSQKIACFGDFGDDSLFVHAFHAEINLALEKGTFEQKKLFKQYLSLFKMKGHVTTEDMEEKMQTGNTKFYGSKQKM